MVKKKLKKSYKVKTRVKRKPISKKNFRVKSSSFHFSNLSFEKKVFSIIVILLLLGVVASIVPSGQITGMGPGPIPGFVPGSSSGGGSSSIDAFENIFDPLMSLFVGLDNFIIKFFGRLFPGDAGNTELLRIRFIFFVFALFAVWTVMKMAGSDNGLANLVFGLGVGYLSTYLIPTELIATTGLMYNSLFLTIIHFAPVYGLWFLSSKIKETRSGYILKCILLFFAFLIMISLGARTEGVPAEWWYITFILNLTIIGIIVFFGYYLYKAFTTTGVEGEIQQLGEEAAPKIQMNITEMIKEGLGKLR